jgi:hypothetical protein
MARDYPVEGGLGARVRNWSQTGRECGARHCIELLKDARVGGAPVRCSWRIALRRVAAQTICTSNTGSVLHLHISCHNLTFAYLDQNSND